MRALVVEDDPVSAKLIDAALKSEGIISEPAETGEDAIDLAARYDFDILVLDIRLPDMDGFEVVRRLRAAKIRTPVLMLSGINETDDKVRGLATGADDYLIKPFHKSELIARIYAILRRSKGHSESVVKTGKSKFVIKTGKSKFVIKTGKLVVNLDTRSVDVDGRRLHVTGKEYSILELLSLRKGTTVTKEMLLDHLYGGIDEPERKIIDVFIAKLRKKIAAAAGGKNYIETVWGSGYVLKDPEHPKRNEQVFGNKFQLIYLQDFKKDFSKEFLESLDDLNRAQQDEPSEREVGDVENRRVFLAHAREDKKRIRELYVELKRHGFDPWLDKLDLLPGSLWEVEIEKAIRSAGVFLACLSNRAVVRRGYLQKEFKIALDVYSEMPPGTNYLIPIKLDECEVPDIQIPSRGVAMRDIHYVELWDDDGLEVLMKGIKHGLSANSG